jgi:hypothetical protein
MDKVARILLLRVAVFMLASNTMAEESTDEFKTMLAVSARRELRNFASNILAAREQSSIVRVSFL